MEIETAARKRALEISGITNLVADRVWKWRLQHRDDAGNPASLEGTGLSALVVKRSGGWTKPIPNSQEYPMLVFEAYSDHSRDPDGNLLKLDADERCYALVREIDRGFHNSSGKHQTWPTGDPDGLYIIGCYRGSEPTQPVDKAGVRVVRVTYDVQTFHSG